ncbi:MAG: RNA polymerase sigma factor [Fibromonadaceae bacterium]|jgi:RNA polymerase sigma-70 factor (ECF subfamily)|nr:RNA polymerase sigma factor [Fibromonadaceae bacterium]
MNITNLWKEYADFVLGICLRYLKDPQIAKDIRQEVFLKIINNGKGFNRKASVKTWIYSITYHCCIDYFRKQKRQKNVTKEYALRETFYARDVEYPMWKVNELSGMPCPISQLMVELYFGEGWSKQELADVFGFDMLQLNKKLQTGMSNLQNLLN